MFAVRGVVHSRWQRASAVAKAAVLGRSTFVLVANGKNILRTQGEIQPRRNIAANLWLENGARRNRIRKAAARGSRTRIAERGGRRIGCKESCRVDDGVLPNVAARSTQTERRGLR